MALREERRRAAALFWDKSPLKSRKVLKDGEVVHRELSRRTTPSFWLQRGAREGGPQTSLRGTGERYAAVSRPTLLPAHTGLKSRCLTGPVPEFHGWHPDWDVIARTD